TFQIEPQDAWRTHAVVMMLLREATWITAVSKAVLARVRELAPEVEPRSSIIANSVRLQGGDSIPPLFTPLRVLCLARLERHKGIHVALRVLQRILPHFPEARLMIAGDGPARSDLEHESRDLGVSHAADFLGWVPPGPELYNLINQSSLLIMPSYVEGL